MKLKVKVYREKRAEEVETAVYLRLIQQEWGPISVHVVSETGEYKGTLMDISPNHGVRVYQTDKWGVTRELTH